MKWENGGMQLPAERSGEKRLPAPQRGFGTRRNRVSGQEITVRRIAARNGAQRGSTRCNVVQQPSARQAGQGATAAPSLPRKQVYGYAICVLCGFCDFSWFLLDTCCLACDSTYISNTLIAGQAGEPRTAGQAGRSKP